MEAIKKQYRDILVQLEPHLMVLKQKWYSLQKRERLIVIAGGIILGLSVIYLTLSGIMAYNRSAILELRSLSKIEPAVIKISNDYKQLKNQDEPKINPVNKKAITDEISTILGEDIKPEIIFQDNRMSVNISSVEFNKAMIFLDALRTNYGVYPDKVTLIKVKPGITTLKFSFEVKDDDEN